MEFFCLDPTRENFEKICSTESSNISVWKVAAINKYGDLWKLDTETIESAKLSIENVLSQKNQSDLNKLWQIFFATGELSILRMLFEFSGDPNISEESREEVFQKFNYYQNKYQIKISEILKENPNFFINHKIPSALSSSQVFDTLIDEKIQELNQTEYNFIEEINSLNLNTKSEKSEKPEAQGKTKEKFKNKKEQKKKLKEASDLFNEIYKNVSKIKLK